MQDMAWEPKIVSASASFHVVLQRPPFTPKGTTPYIYNMTAWHEVYIKLNMRELELKKLNNHLIIQLNFSFKNWKRTSARGWWEKLYLSNRKRLKCALRNITNRASWAQFCHQVGETKKKSPIGERQRTPWGRSDRPGEFCGRDLVSVFYLANYA